MEKIISTFKMYSDKRFSTIAGTLVYFLLMSIAPFFLWLTLVGGNVDVEKLIPNTMFESVRPVLRYMKSSAESAAGGAGLIFIITSLYSSTNFFYHLRRSGEIIYDCPRVKGGLKIRISSLCLIIAAIVLVALIAGVSVTGTKIMNDLLPYYIADVISISFLTALAFIAAVVLNLIASPYKMKFKEAVTGSLLTTALWLIFSVGFAIYTRFATPERLYGKIASVIVFLLWCYIMMSCLVIGIIKNGSLMPKKATLKHY